jgi:FAD/FMN-containing dehydrogenase
MKTILILAGWRLVSVLPHSTATPNGFPSDQQSAPDGCRVVHTDKQWPANSVWKAALPNVLTRGVAKDKLKHPDYRLEVKTPAEVQAAVKFATKHNIRLSILNSGHDFLGRLVKVMVFNTAAYTIF